jgi:poly-beta-hydroxyalkanoate depolymerase
MGEIMLAGWKNMRPGEQYLSKYIDLYEHIADKCCVARSEHFRAMVREAVDLPGRYYLQAIEELFKTNRFAKGEFIGLGENCR